MTAEITALLTRACSIVKVSKVGSPLVHNSRIKIDHRAVRRRTPSNNSVWIVACRATVTIVVAMRGSQASHIVAFVA
jgi:hypothetical protein